MKTIRELINNVDATDANYCMDVLDVARKLARWAQVAVDTNNANQHLGRDDSRELAIAVLDFGSVIGAFEHGSPSGEEVTAFRQEVIKP